MSSMSRHNVNNPATRDPVVIFHVIRWQIRKKPRAPTKRIRVRRTQVVTSYVHYLILGVSTQN